MSFRPAILLALALALSACAGNPRPAPDASFEAPYTLDGGDKLRVTVFGQEGLTNSYAVDGAGKISMPLIGRVDARGLTTAQVAAQITSKLRSGYVREPHVAVEVETYRPFFILGEVTAAGQYAYVNNLTVETAVAIAGGFTPRANRANFTIVRNINGVASSASVPPYFNVRPGDTITVHERWF
ncbi:MAG: polysaccharide export protein [Xanthobacteraceae bacterium]|nr:polysaccharide export protein [Xanthobacteraceae bacterium]MBX3533112.1 polysaccharide export protein [Xanthobacteraceae bacterium]MBX3547539.1 polysaccharide export protein [Xanthobacteraceae bacterium]MCW5676218.1 polysaccharide export protein [Xanthobacteraceae bacterium]MCW5677340.1 polysaccharide export protein [Xanthobacteraceae bacterium]